MTDQSRADIESRLRALAGAPFTKMTGSGNDFVVFDARELARELVEVPQVIQAICNRHNGIGADGVVILQPSAPSAAIAAAAAGRGEQRAEPEAPILLRYFNSDGSLGEMCGNATLCSTRLAVENGLASQRQVVLDTDSGRVTSRIVDDTPEIDLAPVAVIKTELPSLELMPSESRAGFALVGVPHVVLLSELLEQVPTMERGRSIRQSPLFSPAGTNVNWVAPLEGGRWAYRTYERGVEGETLACGTGAVAAAILLVSWGLDTSPVRLMTRSGREVCVSLLAHSEEQMTSWSASLRGEGRVVFRGQIGNLG